MCKTCGIATIVLGAWAAAALSSFGAQSQGTSSETAGVPASVTEIGQLGEEIYDLANDDKWTELSDRLDSLNRVFDLFHPETEESREASVQLVRSITDLEESAAATNALGAMQAANQITLIAIDLSEQFHPQTPADVARLGYYGRELEIWSEDKSQAKLEFTAIALQKNWTSVRPGVLTHGGAAAAERFDALVQKLAAAQSPDEYSRVVAPIRAEIGNLEKLFLK
jgi:hypothetical protein